nr:MAG TPA: hypothetical protein [Caudoviricetes sp.]
MKKKCFKCFVLLLLIYKVFSLVHTPQKIISNNNQKDIQIVHSYTAYQEYSVQKHSTDDNSNEVRSLAFFFCESIIFFEIAKFVYEIAKVHVYIWQLPRVGIGGIIAKDKLMFGSIFHKPNIYCSVGGSCDREGYLWIIRKRSLR